tara:strand:+ start:119 stop:700 length:582 start_codon:yes stop_codon:yes gene_type:complete
MFHGYGSNKEDLFSLEQFFPKSYTVVSFDAPISLPFGGYSWFNIDYSDILENNLDKRYKEINESIEMIMNNINSLIEKENLNKDDVSILGFSQGGSICWKLGLDNSSNFRRIIPISSFIHPSYLNNDLESYANKLIYCSHGSLDDVIPLSIVDDHILKLSKNNDLTYDKFDSGHTISQENLTSLLNWIIDTSI